MKRKVLVLLLVVLITVTAYLYARPTPPVLSIDKVYSVTKVGDTVLVNVTLNNVPSCGGWIMVVVWDPTVVQLTTGGPDTVRPVLGPGVVVAEGPFLKTRGTTRFIINSADNINGMIVMGDGLPGGGSVSGTGVIVALNFTIVNVGTTTIETRPPGTSVNQTLLVDDRNHLVDHVDVYGLITNEGTPPTWTSAEFQNTTIAAEVVILGAASTVIYWRRHPRTAKSERRKAELQPIFEPKDQGESS